VKVFVIALAALCLAAGAVGAERPAAHLVGKPPALDTARP
jgi:hypothetical protein